MRKRINHSPDLHPRREPELAWLDLEQIATVEVTSEHVDFPIESAFTSPNGPGWRASETGEQQIRLIFDTPISLRRIQLRFDEAEVARTQEFTLRWSSARGETRELVRQQWNFSPAGATTETEDYAVDLDTVSVLELSIRPDLNSQNSVATLASWRVA
jgi:hypothetical protein